MTQNVWFRFGAHVKRLCRLTAGSHPAVIVSVSGLFCAKTTSDIVPSRQEVKEGNKEIFQPIFIIKCSSKTPRLTNAMMCVGSYCQYLNRKVS